MNSADIKFTRVNRSMSEAEGYYSRLSKFYDWLATSEKKFIDQGLDILSPQQGEKILEIGFGTGFAQEKIIRAVGDGLSVGLDLSAGMGKIARINLIKSGLAKQLALVLNNTLSIPFTRASFDGIFSSFTLELFDTPRIPEVLAECQRVLKTDGRLVVVSLSKDSPLPLMGSIYEKLHTLIPRILDCRPIPVIQLARNAGFDVRKSIETRMWGLPVIMLDARKRSDQFFSASE